jgi:hypothetical protein
VRFTRRWTVPHTPESRRAAGSIGAHTAHSRHTAEEMTGAAHQGYLRKFEREVDPDGVLPEDERRRRANHALAAHMKRLALASAKARAARATA